MSGTLIGEASIEVSLSQAILLYCDRNNAPLYATMHTVSEDPKSRRPTIQAGRPVDRVALIQALTGLGERAAAESGYLSGTVLSVSPHAVTWWCPTAPRRVYFDCEELGKRSRVVPHPSLVFQAALDGFRVFALPDDSRPTPDTALFEPPYFNTWNDGKICIGTAHVPGQVSVSAVPGWEAGFFDSAFTHPNHGKQRLSYPNGEFAFWRDMLAGVHDSGFPRAVLVPTEWTLGTLIAHRPGRSAA